MTLSAIVLVFCFVVGFGLVWVFFSTFSDLNTNFGVSRKDGSKIHQPGHF